MAYKPHAQGLELQSGERHAGMYAHDSRSRVTSIEWITIHVLSEVRVMTSSFQSGVSACIHVMLGAAAVCELEHSQMKQIFDGLLGDDIEALLRKTGRVSV